MFDIGWTELLVIACVAIIVVGPKDLPRMLRSLGQTMGQLRRMSREFQSTFNDALREAEKQADISDMKKQVEEAANFNPLGDIKKSIEETAVKTGTVAGDAAEKAASAEPVVTGSAPGANPEPEAADGASGKTAAAETAPPDPETKPDVQPVTEDVKA
ncbi:MULTISPECIES: Sec-independent protein translocase protein TatB [unclassified Roseibium]|uniref:Sec-independent protein translocase protein TatB n=1 Tax=unclassified Roseibium TaxID=2629323 RepID=UPI00316FB8AC